MLKKYAALTLVLLTFFLLQYKNFTHHTQSFRFGDESEHLTPAWMLENHQTQLYVDLYTNHQPLPILTSQVFFKIIDYQNIFMLIERVRQLMFAISMLGALVLVYKFKLAGVAAVFLIETVKFYLFGYHILAESLVLYPTMLVVGIIASYLFWPRQQASKKTVLLENVIFGISLFWIAFNLLPSWPFVIGAFIIYYYFQDNKSRKLLIGAIILPALLLFSIVDLHAWFQSTIIDNIKYFIPYESETNNWTFYTSIIFYPFQTFLNLEGPISKYILVSILILASATAAILSSLKSKKSFILKFLLIYVLITLLNLRTTSTNIGFYTAFHLLPYMGGFTIFILLILKKAMDLKNKTIFQKILVSFSVFLIFGALFLNTAWWREQKDKASEHFIQYGDIQSLGSALNKLKTQDDKFMVGPLDGLFNIAADIPIAGKQNAYLDWSYRSEKSRNDFNKLLTNTPPTFVYFPKEGDYFQALTPYLENKYTQLQRYDGGLTNAYMLNSEIHKRTNQQWQEYQSLFYKIPDAAQY